MSIQILIDMNLSPDWAGELTAHGWPSVHWSTVGDPKATDHQIMHWARANGYVVFTHDLDFGTMLALDARPGLMSKLLQVIYREHEDHLVIIAVAHAKRQPGYWSNR